MLKIWENKYERFKRFSVKYICRVFNQKRNSIDSNAIGLGVLLNSFCKILKQETTRINVQRFK